MTKPPTVGAGTNAGPEAESDAPAPPSEESQHDGPSPGSRWPAVLSFAALAAFALIGIGSPLLGLKVFAATDLVVQVTPYREAGFADVTPQNDYLNDTIDALIPNTALFVSALWRGDFAAWNPYIVGGVVLGAAPNYAVASPLTLPYFLLPAWLAPGYVKLLEIAVAAAGTFLFLRRIRLGRAAALLGGLVFVSSGFMVAWTNWPQTRVAAFIPVVFWALERLVQQRRVRDGGLLALAVASMLLGGFPAVTGYALATAGLYVLLRVVAEYPGRWRRLVGVLAGAAAGVAGGVLLSAIQLLPFVSSLSGSYVAGRRQQPSDHLLSESLITMLAPWAFGSTDPRRPPYWYLHVNLVESVSYVGAAALVLVVVAVATARAGRGLLPRGVWGFLVASCVAWVVVIYLGRFPLAVLQQLPILFSHNYVGRARSVLGFLIAALAAVGFELVLRHRRRVRGSPRTRWQLGYAVAVWAGAGLVLGGVWWDARRAAAHGNTAREPGDTLDRVGHLDQQVLFGLGFLAVALAAVAGVWWFARGPASRRAARFAAALLPVLVATQALTFALPYWPRSDPDTFYPVTDVHRYLSDHLGHDRFAGTGGAMYVGADSHRRLRALTGHGFLNGPFAEVVDGLPGRQLGDPPTYINFPAKHSVATHPVLDRLAVRYFVVAPGKAGFGEWRAAATDGSTATLRPGAPVTVTLTAGGPLRGVAFTPEAPLPPPGGATRIEVSLRDTTGREVTRSERHGFGMVAGKPFVIPLAAERVAPGTALEAVVTVHSAGPLVVRGHRSAPAVTAIAPIDDGLRLAYAGSSTVYERLDVLPRIRWASQVLVERDPRHRVARIAAGEVADDQVVLNRPGAPAEGRPADVEVVADGTDEIEVRVAAEGAGHLVVADALQQDWTVTVDGEPAELVPADHGLVAVAVPAGSHTVRLDYRMPYHNAGAWVTGSALVALPLLVGFEWWWRRRVGGRDQTS